MDSLGSVGHLQRWRRRNVALAGEEGEPVEQQIAGTRRALPACGQNSRGDLVRIPFAHQTVRGKRSRERFEADMRPAGRFPTRWSFRG
jgi:hypothetical protein